MSVNPWDVPALTPDLAEAALAVLDTYWDAIDFFHACVWVFGLCFRVGS